MEFQEVQKFKQFWLWLIIGATILPFCYVLYLILVAKSEFNTELSMVLIATGVISISVISTFMVLRLETNYSSAGVTYRFFPVHLKSKTISWDSISQWEVKTYSPLGDYGGWGLRYGRGGKAFNVSGNQGILLHLKSGKTLLFGTQNPEALKETLRTLKVTSKLEVKKDKISG